MRHTLVMLFFLSLTIPATGITAEPLREDCKVIKQSAKRLACFDKQNSTQPKSQADKLADEEEARVKAEEEKKKVEAEAARKDFLVLSKEILRAFRKMEAKTQTGISYRNYPEPLSNLRFELTEFIRSSGGKYNQSFNSALISAMKHFEYAVNAWDFGISKGGGSRKIPLQYMSSEYYSEAEKYTENVFGSKYIKYDDLLSVIWGAASQEIKNAEKIYETINTPM